MRTTMEEFQRGAEEVQMQHQALQLRYQQGQTELAAAQQQAEAAATQNWLATAEAQQPESESKVTELSQSEDMREVQTLVTVLHQIVRQRIQQHRADEVDGTLVEDLNPLESGGDTSS